MLTFGPNDCAHRVKIIFKMSLEIKLGKVLKKKKKHTPKKCEREPKIATIAVIGVAIFSGFLIPQGILGENMELFLISNL